MKLAKNYCRNPTKRLNGPWCYTLEPTVIDDECDVPLCNYRDCIITGPGAEYGGNRSYSSSRRKCKSWNKRYKLSNVKSIKFPNKHFPDGSRTKANNYCRNPNDDIGGPWCYVEERSYGLVEKEHCDIPFCDDRDCLMYSRNSSTYSILTGLNNTYGNISFWIKLWNPFDEQKAEARILLSLLPIPSSAEKIAQDWKAGVELLISNNVSGQTYPIIDSGQLFEDTPKILLSSTWTGLWITWGGGFISLGIHGVSKPLITDKYKFKSSISSLYLDSFLHYGVMGTGVLWSMEFCQNYCESHITFGDDFLIVRPMQKNNDTQYVRFYVRASRNIKVRLYQSPGVLFPCFTMEINRNDVISLLYQESELAMKQHLKEVIIKGSLDYWIWKEFTISIFDTHLRLISQIASESEEILFVNHNLLATMRWFSFGSNQTVAHWTFFCPPDVTDAVEDPQPPNCIHNTADYQYNGIQWTSEKSLPCIPWVAKEIPDDEKIPNNFAEKSITKVLNRCRNPSHDSNGPYCYVISTPHATDIEKQYCSVRICRSSDCRMAGTANDYIGTLSTTRSGRTCAKWLSDYDLEQMQKSYASLVTTVSSNTPNLAYVKRSLMEQNISSESSLPTKLRPSQLLTKSKFVADKPIHNVNPVYLNDSLYPERNVQNASNYCRNPSRNIAGTWCYTTDPLVPQDLCDVRDCEKPEECTFFVKGYGIGRRLYVLPEHRTEGLHFSLKSWEPDQPDSITFVFTANDGLNSRYILKIGALDNEKVLLYYQSEEKGCHIENTQTNRYSRILPLSSWSKEDVVRPNKLMLMIRAKGIIWIPLLLLPATPGFYELILGKQGQWIHFVKNTYPRLKVYHKQKSPKLIFTTNYWTNITIKWSGNTIDVFCNETIVFHYVHRLPLIFYFFSLAVDVGSWATWSANCIPSDIDGSPLDGGWSEWGAWECSASCNGGIGIRKRYCNSPEPNVKGEPCIGPSTMTGRCNMILCGDITDDTITLIKRGITQNYTALTVQEGESILLLFDSNIIKTIRTESPNSEIQWSHNGIFLQEEEHRLDIKDYEIIISRSVLNDSGVYILTVHRIDGTYMILKIVTLAVVPIKESFVIRETLSMKVICNCIIIGYVYSDLKIYWTIDDKVWKDYGVTLPIAANVHYLPTVNKSHNGIWKCIVEQVDLNFKWITNVISVKVLGPPNWRTHLMEDKLTRPIFGWMPNEEFVAYTSLAIILFLICCIIIGFVLYIRFRESLKVNSVKIQKMMRTNKAKIKNKYATKASASMETKNKSTMDDTGQLEETRRLYNDEHLAKKSVNINHATESHRSRFIKEIE